MSSSRTFQPTYPGPLICCCIVDLQPEMTWRIQKSPVDPFKGDLAMEIHYELSCKKNVPGVF